MDAALKLWAVILVVGALNYLSRLSFIAFFARRSMPPLLERALRYVPAAMLTALIVPMVVEVTPQGLHPHLPKVLARLMRAAGFTVTAQRVHVLFNTELTENSFSAFDMRAVAKYVPGHHGLTEADAAAWLADLQARSDAGEFFYSLNRYVVMATA